MFYILNPTQNLERMLKGLTLQKCVLYTESYTKRDTNAERVNPKICVLYTESITKLGTSAERVRNEC